MSNYPVEGGVIFLHIGGRLCRSGEFDKAVEWQQKSLAPEVSMNKETWRSGYRYTDLARLGQLTNEEQARRYTSHTVHD
jgi:hypothetical protein